MFNLLLKNAQVVDPLNGVNDVCDVAVENGVIAAVGQDLGSSAREVIYFTGLVLQPGIIDSHVHLGTMWGSAFGPKMLAMNGVTTCLDMAGPLDDILDNVPQYGAGINMAILQFASPPFTFKSTTPSKQEMETLIDASLEQGALGVKLLGGHYPLTPAVSSELIKTALERRAYVAWHAGTTEHGSNKEGMIEAVEMAASYPLHLAHINAYCRGRVKTVREEAEEAAALLTANPNLWCESYVSPMNGTILTCDSEGRVIDHVTQTCLATFGLPPTAAGNREAIRRGVLFVVRDTGFISELTEGEEALRYWTEKGTATAGSFPVNPALSRFMLAQAKRPDGTFVVDAISTDGGCIPRNVTLSVGLSLVKFGALTLSEFVVKTSVNPARHLRLADRGHLTPGAAADITVFDFERQKAIETIVNGETVMKSGELFGHSMRFITTAKGAPALQSKGFETIEIALSGPEPERFRP